MKRLSIIALAAAAAVAGLALGSSSGSAQQPGEQTINLVKREGPVHYVDHAPRSTKRFSWAKQRFDLSPGDQITFIDRYFDASGKRVATGTGVCAVVIPKIFGAQCSTSVVFADGQIVASGFEPPTKSTFRIAVTGGTGAYEGLTGSVSFVRTDEQAREAGAVFRLRP